MTEKTCTTCKLAKPINHFYTYKNRVGRAIPRPRCKPCMISQSVAYAKTPKGKEVLARMAKTKGFKDSQRKYYRSEKSKNMRKRMRDKNPERFSAYTAVRRAIAKGLLKRTNACSECGASGKTELHHPKGYSLEHRLNVVELCVACHHGTHEANQAS